MHVHMHVCICFATAATSQQNFIEQKFFLNKQDKSIHSLWHTQPFEAVAKQSMMMTTTAAMLELCCIVLLTMMMKRGVALIEGYNT